MCLDKKVGLFESIVNRSDEYQVELLIKCHVHVGSPFLELCVQNGSPRDAYTAGGLRADSV